MGFYNVLEPCVVGKLHYATVPVQPIEVDDDVAAPLVESGSLKAYQPGTFVELVVPGAFKKLVDEDRSRVFAAGSEHAPRGLLGGLLDSEITGMSFSNSSDAEKPEPEKPAPRPRRTRERKEGSS